MTNAETDNDDDTDELMCDCTGTTRSLIERLYFDGYDMDRISSKTGIMTGCGSCEWDIEAYLAALAEADKT